MHVHACVVPANEPVAPYTGVAGASIQVSIICTTHRLPNVVSVQLGGYNIPIILKRTSRLGDSVLTHAIVDLKGIRRLSKR
eukprot:scaffold392767_cov31-Prasinocladus_malaysianus.AAC.2